MNVIYVRTSENQLPSKAYIRETLLQNTTGRARVRTIRFLMKGRVNICLGS